MNAIFTIVVVLFVTSVLAVAAYTLYAMSPFASHTDQFRDPQTGKWLGESPLD